jgi:hypothetical protein
MSEVQIFRVREADGGAGRYRYVGEHIGKR